MKGKNHNLTTPAKNIAVEHKAKDPVCMGHILYLGLWMRF